MPTLERSTKPAERLRRARERAGYHTASEFARASNLNYTTYAHHENGRREIMPNSARVYADLLSVPVGKLLYGDEGFDVPAVPVTSSLVSRGKVTPIRTKNGRASLAKLPDTSEMVGLEIIGDEFYPAYRDGDVVIHRALSADSYRPDRVHGLECVVRLSDGTELLRHITIQRNGRATLHGHLGAAMPPLTDQDVIAAEPVEIVLRKPPRRLSNY